MANNPRIYLWLLLIFAAWLNYEAWQRDYAPPATAAAANPSAPITPANDIGSAIPQAAPSDNASTPAAPAAAPGDSPVPAPSTATPAQPGPEVPSLTATAVASEPIHVKTDVLDLYISPI